MSRLAVAYTGFLMKGRRVLARWVPREVLARIPGSALVLTSLREFIQRRVIPARMEWVQVQQGFAQGLWLEIDLSRERTWWSGTHEPGVQKALQDVLRENSVLYDVGAHIGFFALPAARCGALVVAFEPDSDNTVRLRANINRNHLGHKIDVVDAAAWSESASQLTFRRGLPRSQGGVSYGECEPVIASGELIEVRAIKIDDFVSGGGPTPHVLKVDVEGGAGEVLRGADRTVRDSQPLLMVEVHSERECASVTEFLEHHSYQARWEIPPESFPRHCFASASGK